MRLKYSIRSFFLLSAVALFTVSCDTDKGEETKQRQLTGNPKLDKLKLPDGFVAEHLLSPGENDEGSWVAMTFDDKNRLITADQYGFLYRLDIPAIGSDSLKPTVERLIIGNVAEPQVGMGYAQGLLYAFNSIYVMVNHNGNETFAESTGLYRIQDLDGDDQYESVTTIKKFTGQPGEHGPHSIKLSPDGQSLYIVAGNHTDVPEMDSYRLPNVWQEDNLFPEIKDPRGHANNRMAPGGWVANIDPEGKHWELVSAGYRNPFDIAFNEVGDLFTYDSDMEWDFGMPWYRPTRINHVTSGSEYGWRTGNQKWSPNYPDNLPATLNIGQGSPTNVMYGTGSKFPAKYRNSLFAFDWSFGIIYSMTLTPKGGTYEAKAEEFISGSPLPLTDGVIGPDGAMYLMTGGRRLESDLYRVYYDGDIDEKETGLTVADLPAEAKTRRELEALHVPGAPASGLDLAWANLTNKDRFVQYAARIAVEHQPINSWKAKALAEKNPVVLTQTMIALSRHSDKGTGAPMLQALMGIDYSSLNEKEKQDLLRAFELILARQGEPTGSLKSDLVAYLDANFPANNNNLDRALAVLLVYLDAPTAVEKTLALLDNAKDDPDYQKTFTSSEDLIMRNPQYGMDIANMLANVPPAQQTYLATVLGGATTGWTPELHEKYFTWIQDAFKYKGGRSYVGFIDRARKMALQHVAPGDFDKYNELSGAAMLTGNGNDLVNTDIQPEGPGKRWTVEEAEPLMADLSGRDLARGKAMYAASQCLSCHTMAGQGGVIGPDLSQLGTRFSPKDILQATINPSDEISEQYVASVLELKDGSSVMGRIINEDETSYSVSQNPFSPDVLRKVEKKNISTVKDSKISVMMPGMINRLNDEELKDLMAYLVSGGNPNHTVYQTKAQAQE
ncbi:putative heme-binding domain-containing protein [Algoriphagus ratkowskyi]|uniref:C-type cytochrome n=1 Tax=Algoriphagus ratkowskyi TaxID=57028 RepID=A0A2W7R9P9_9BACT|nr:c-type cytochrome [Algoriphagus ratkowskyi]PZX55866.1 putative heme-binding domain-containing protein [Algoriphagus ratkowskyi]TXD77313.1 c-type cytochrome [Algoriphagus ratkowskyi]